MAGARGLALKRPSALPGFGLALGFTLTYLSLIVLIPLAALGTVTTAEGASRIARETNERRIAIKCSAASRIFATGSSP